LFYGVTIPLRFGLSKKQKGKIIDARKIVYMVNRKHLDFTEADIVKIADTFTAFQERTLEDCKGISCI
jgi:type I restriction enzyme M protein